MNPFTFIKRLFSHITTLIKQAISLAQESGLTDDIIHMTLPFIRSASSQFTENSDKREWVVRRLLAAKVPESVARLALELAFKLYQAELTKLEEHANG